MIIWSAMKTIVLLMLCGILSLSLITSIAQDCETVVDLADYVTTDSRPFITLNNDQFMSGDTLYAVQGINYYPKDYPWRRFLTETDMSAVRSEFELMNDTGFNTLRIFLWNQALFQCDGGSAQPVESAFDRLDVMMRLAREYDFG